VFGSKGCTIHTDGCEGALLFVSVVRVSKDKDTSFSLPCTTVEKHERREEKTT